MPIAQTWAYFDHAAVSPLPEPTRRALADWTDEAARSGDTAWPSWSQKVEGLRRQAAHLIGASPEEIALIRNTTEGVNLVAEGFPWQPGDNVVTLADEFPTNQYPWMNLAQRGVETRPAAGGTTWSGSPPSPTTAGLSSFWTLSRAWASSSWTSAARRSISWRPTVTSGS
jgi:selenocysteine lyase/cysteine desulfurase